MLSSAIFVDRRAVAANQREHVAAVVDDGDGDVPPVLHRFGAGGGLDLFAVLHGEDGFGFHRI
jgi:hypothetical protein